jgi:hypothetical protein
MKHLGDITKIDGAKIPVVDCIVGGSPCQDLSVAGKREGLDGERSGLFMEQIRVVKEMREHDRSTGRTGEFIRPRWMVWENVPGAFSSNGGKDFQTVLEEIVKIVEPECPDLSTFVETRGGADRKYRKLRGIGEFGIGSNGKNSPQQVVMVESGSRGGLAATEQILEIADGKHAKESDGSWRRFGLLSGTFTPDCRIDKRLYQGSRQSQGAEAHGDKHKTGQNDSGEHP